jgi:hypothetical protein
MTVHTHGTGHVLPGQVVKRGFSTKGIDPDINIPGKTGIPALVIDPNTIYTMAPSDVQPSLIGATNRYLMVNWYSTYYYNNYVAYTY